MCHLILLHYESSSCDTDTEYDETIDAPEIFVGTSMHCVHWSTIFMIHNIAASDENDETLQAPETLDHRCSSSAQLETASVDKDKDEEAVVDSDLLECASTTPTDILIG